MTNKPILNLFIARHGETWSNAGHESAAGHDDPELTPNGFRQAELLGERLSLGRLDAVFASPLSRAIVTAHEAAVRQNEPPPIEIMPELTEIGVSRAFRPCSLSEIRRRFPGAEMYKGSAQDDIESLPDEDYTDEMNHMRAKQAVDYFRARFTRGENVLAVAHGAFNTCFLRAALGFDHRLPFGFCQHNAGLSKIKYYSDGRCRPAFINDTSHLFTIDDGIAFWE
ncbi:MAG: histidine phosphatase family protein [Oscillospiraceae bacterium]|nr:histidine phosphatase family protein [Oscillospiraceae bacterium]